ncbi:MAG: TonB-dependent receptor, partial [Blastocatellia bacterium]|nr:TonB-dependent receptor [Blastocatellia bacterium]
MYRNINLFRLLLCKSLSIVAMTLLITVCVASANAQSTFGNVRGVVQDETGAVVSGAKVTITDKRTNNSFTTQSSGEGAYQFNNLLPGEYQISVEASGFKTLALTGVKVELNQTTDVPTILAVGTTGEIVEISASGSELVETTTTTLSKSFDSRQTVELAQTAAGGGIYNLALIAPNVSSSGGVGVGSGGSIGGQRPRNNNFMVDGIDNNDKGVTGPQIYISPETVAEFTLLANQFSAEFGRSNGGQFVTVTKSGTNEYHGTGYFFVQNRFLNALDTLQKNAGVVRERSAVRDNPNLSLIPRSDFSRYGGNVGGPIVKDKLFFFTSYEGQQTGLASAPGGLTAPTAEGFSRLSSISGLSQTNLGIFRQFVPTAPINDAGSITVGGVQVPIGNVFFNAPAFTNQRNFVLNLDFTQSEKTQHRTRFIFDRIRTIDTAAVLPVFYTDRPINGRLFSYTFLHSFSPSLTYEARFAYRRSTDNIVVPNFRFPGLDAFPNIGLLDLAIDIGPNPNAPQSGIENSYQLVQNVAYTVGNHSIKFGFDGRKLISPQRFVQRERGDYQYQSTDLFLRDVSPDFLAQRNVGGNTYYGDQFLLYFYGQDDWRIAPNLTLNFGLRYEYQQVPFGARQQNLNQIASVPGLIEFRSPREELDNFAPKIGLAYSPSYEKGILGLLFGKSGESSIRAGFSLGYDYIFDNVYTLASPPQFQQTKDIAPAAALPNFLAGGGIPPIPTPTGNDPVAARAATTAFIPDQQVPYSITYTLSYQRQFLKDWSLEMRYLGTRGIRLLTQNRINRTPAVTSQSFLPTFFAQPSQRELDALPLTLNAILARPTFNEFGAAGFNQQNLVGFVSNGNSV